jgi:hypothetical protein
MTPCLSPLSLPVSLFFFSPQLEFFSSIPNRVLVFQIRLFFSCGRNKKVRNTMSHGFEWNKKIKARYLVFSILKLQPS